MPTGAKSGFGSLLKRGDGASPEVFATVAEIKEISGPSYEHETLDATNNDTANNAMEFVSVGFYDGGEVEFTFNYIPTNTTQKNVLADLTGRVLRNWRLEFPQFGGTPFWLFSAYVTKFDPQYPHDDIVECSVTLKISGNPTVPT